MKNITSKFILYNNYFLKYLLITIIFIYVNNSKFFLLHYKQKQFYIVDSLFSYNFTILSNKSNFNKVVFFIISSSIHFNKRNKIKKEWIKLCLRLSCQYNFVIATKDQESIIKNYNKNDIIGIDILDSYYNLTILTSNIYKYCVLYRLKADYIIKNDDDIYPNIPLIFIYINIYIDKNKISGYFYPPMKVHRNKRSSIYLPPSIYHSNIFPAFVAGGFVITHHNLIPCIYRELLKEKKIIYREDMHLAVIYKKLNISFQNIQKYYHRKEKKITSKNKLNDICFHGF